MIWNTKYLIIPTRNLTLHLIGSGFITFKPGVTLLALELTQYKFGVRVYFPVEGATL